VGNWRVRIVARITIPQRNRAGLSKLLALSAGAFGDFVHALEAQPPGLGLPIDAPEAINLPEIPETDIDQIVTAIVSLSVVRWSRDIHVDSFVSDVADAIATFNPAGSSEETKQRLRTILQIESLLISSKAITVFTDYQRTLHASKVLTDLRYVFRSDPDDEPYGAVIAHLLRLTYHEDTEHKEFFVAMDDGDLRRFKDVIERAEKKARTLRRKLDTEHTAYLGIEPDIEENND
jgi:hypothetical protein